MSNIDLSRPVGAYPQIEQLLQQRFIARDLSLFARRPAVSLLAGGRRTRFRGRGVDFEEVRLYQPGDDIRSIDWRVTARTQIPHTKLFSEERERPVFIVCDLRSSMFFGTRQCFKSVLACTLASALGWSALAAADRVGGLVFGDTQLRDIRPKRSKHALLALIHQLHDFASQLTAPYSPLSHANSDSNRHTNSLERILTDTRRLAKPGSAVFIISDCHDFNEACERQLHQLSRHCDLTLFQIFDPMEMSLPSGSDITVTDGVQRRALSTLDARFARRYKNSADAQLSQLQQACQKLGVALASVATDSDSHSLLRELYGKRQKRPVAHAGSRPTANSLNSNFKTGSDTTFNKDPSKSSKDKPNKNKEAE